MDDLDRVIGIQKRRVSSLYAVAKKSQDKKAEQKYLDALLILKVLKGEKGCCEIPAPNVPDATQRQKPKNTGDINRRSNRAMARWISPRCCPPVRGCNRPKPYAAPAECNQCWIRYLDQPIEEAK